jgi:ANTAR domain
MGIPDDRSGQGPVVRRSGGRWVVERGASASPDEQEDVDELVNALVLANLLAADFDPGQRPAKPSDTADENVRLRVAIAQLEHALSVRVVVEQAIGVLAERGRVSPRDAFEHLRKIARSHGRKVHELAVQVVASVTDPTIRLPGDLPQNSR